MLCAEMVAPAQAGAPFEFLNGVPAFAGTTAAGYFLKPFLIQSADFTPSGGLTCSAG